MKLEYIVAETEASREFEVFRRLHEDDVFKSMYNSLHEVDLKTEMTIVSEAAMEPELVLPLVKINEHVVTVGRLLSLKELSDHLDIGLGLQEEIC